MKQLDISNSKILFEKAEKLIPGGVNSPVRAFKSVGSQPAFIKEGHGSRIVDEDGNSYVDYVCSWGPLIFGHAHPRIVTAIKAAAETGTTFGAATAAEVTLAEMIVDAVPSVEMVRLVSSGTEAVMSAIRLARGFTRRDKIIKFEGAYHGGNEFGAISLFPQRLVDFPTANPTSAGVTRGVCQEVLVAGTKSLFYRNIFYLRRNRSNFHAVFFFFV